MILTGIIGILLMSWELLKKLGWLETDVSLESLYSNWLIGYSSLLGPIAGIMIVDYFLVKNQSYDVSSPCTRTTRGIRPGTWRALFRDF